MARKGGDIFFVLASSLVCCFLFFSVIMPKVRTTRETRKRLEGVVTGTKAIVRNVKRVDKRRKALESGDPFFLTASLRWYLELHGQPWSEPQKEKSDAGDPEPGRS